jgi:hypothetical protein
VRLGAFGISYLLRGAAEYYAIFIMLFPFSVQCPRFSAVAAIKSKYRAKINVEKEMTRVAVSGLIPRFEKVRGDQQAHPSK